MKLKDKIALYFLNKKLQRLKSKLKRVKKNQELENKQLAELDKMFETIPKTKSDRLQIEFMLSDLEYYANTAKQINVEISKVLTKIGFIKYGKECDCEECKKNRMDRLM